MQRNKQNWQSSLDIKNPNVLYAWLNHAGSFMQRLNQYGIANSKIDVIREGWFKPEAWEGELLQLKDDTAWIREVCILSEKRVWMYARTVVPKDMLQEKQELSCLANRSLGSVLFQDPKIKRDKFDFIFIEPAELWQDFLTQALQQWVRRSLFNLEGRALLLSEIFMPDLTTLCMEN